MGKVKIKPIEEVYLTLRPDWNDPKKFEEVVAEL